MSTPHLDETQLVDKNVKPVEQSLRKLSSEDHVELLEWIKPCSVILDDVLQQKQNLKVRCLVHNRYKCKCINRNQRHMKRLFCSGCSDKKKKHRCQSKQSDTSQEKQRKKMKILNYVNKQFFKENSADTNMCAGETSGTVQEIPNSSASKTLNSHDFSSSKPEVQAYQCDEFSIVFVDVGNDLVRSDYLFEEDEDICKVSSKNLFAYHKDIDYQSVKVEQYIEGSSREIDISVHNLDMPLLNINAVCTSNDKTCWATNQIHSKIKEETDNYEELSIINESIISIESHPVSEIKSLEDTGENIMPVLDKSSSDEMPDKSIDKSETKNIFIVQKPLKADEEVQVEVETNLELQIEVQTLNWTLQSDLQIKPETKSRDYDATVGEEKYVSELCVADKNMQLNSRHDQECQNQSNENAELNVDRPLFGCTMCGKAFRHLSSLTRHKRTHTGEKPFGCTVCGKSFRYVSTLTSHKRIHTGEKLFGCTICGKAFTEKGNLTNHNRIHTGEKPFNCSTCGKAFTEKSTLAKHKRIHIGEKPFECSICGKAFMEKSTLTKHKRIHIEEKPFECSICGKAFKQKGTLADHKRLHTGDRPFGCTVCGKVFTRLSHLSDHKRIHTGEKPYGCTICGKAFTHRNSLINHKYVHTR